MAGVAACAALVVALAGGWGSAGPAPQARPAPRHHATEIQLAAFSVVADPDGSTTLTLGPGQMINPTAVRQALAEHGIPALVTAGEFCRPALATWWCFCRTECGTWAVAGHRPARAS